MKSHCWHATGIEKPMYPPLIQHVCCNCGLKKDIPMRRITRQEGHGILIPETFTLNFPVEECLK